MVTPVLICDDSNMARKQMARAIPDDWNVDVSFAGNGKEALDVIKNNKVNILFLDLNMPVMDGYQALKAIKEQKLDTTVIVVSGDVQPEARKRVIEMGALDFIRKPVSRDDIKDISEKHGVFDGLDSVDAITEIQSKYLDCYQEIVNVAMGQAADLLARLLQVFVVLPIPKVNMLEVSELKMALTLAEDNQTFSAVCQGFIGAGISGEALIIFNDGSFSDVAKLLKYEGDTDEAVERELIMDVASILVGACIKGIADQLNTSFSQGHPMILGQHVMVKDLMKANEGRWKKTLAIEVTYEIENYNIQCDLLLLFTEDSIETLNERISYLLDEE